MRNSVPNNFRISSLRLCWSVSRLVLIALSAFFMCFEVTVFGERDKVREYLEAGESLKDTMEFLSNLGSRLPGYEGNIKAADYVYEIFNQLGLEEVRKEDFSVTIPMDKGASLEGPGGEKIKLYCLWPNMVRTSTLSQEGISGKLIYAGKGEYKDYNGYDLEDAVVALDFNCGTNWLKAAGLGAKAIIFVEPEETMRIEAERKFVEVPLNVPRFMLAREKIKLLKSMQGEKITLKARMEWEKVKSWNICGFIQGKDENLSKELVVISAYYDSISVVPMKAPGAESACGIATLIEIAKDLRENPPDRTVFLLATSAHFIGLRGIDAFVQRHCRNISPFKEMIEEPINVSLFIGLDLSSRNDEIGVFHRGNFFTINEFYYQRLFAPFGKKFEEYAQNICGQRLVAREIITQEDIEHVSARTQNENESIEKIRKIIGAEVKDIFVNGISPKRGINWSSYIPDYIALDSELVMVAGIPAISLVTVNDMRSCVDTPVDTVQKVNFVNLLRQVQFLKPLIRRALNDPHLFPESKMKLKDSLGRLEGRIVTFNPSKSFVPDDPVEGAVAFIRKSISSFMGVRGSFYELTNENGEFIISGWSSGLTEAYKIDPQDGEIILAPDRGVNGDQQYPMINGRMIVLFPCVSTDIYDLVDPRYLTTLSQVNVFDTANSTPFAYGYSVDETVQRTSDVSPYGVIFSQPGKRLKVGMASSIVGLRMLFLNSPGIESKDMAEGMGYGVDSCRRLTQSSFYAAQDMLNLNEFRVKELAKYGVVNNRLNDLSAKAKKALREAEKAKSERNWDRFAMSCRRALGLVSRAYPDVKATANDVIKGMIFYMALLIPFAFFMERLTFGFTDIKKQILGVFGIFLLIYIIMRLVHPAFRISNAPEVILLAFIVLTLSAIVLSIVSSKFQEQMEKMKQKRAKVYQADVGRISASATAFSLGISNMKRRKVRTILTCVTLVLLTFTVLSFTSVKTYMQYNQVPRRNTPSYQGALIRDRVWYPLEEPALDYIESEFSEGAVVSPRAWIISRDIGKSCHIKIKVLGQEGRSGFAMAALGLSPQEKEVTHPEKHLIAGEWFDENDEKVCILPSELTERLGISLEDVGRKKIRILGEVLTLKGILDSSAMKDFKDLDDERITPVNFVVMSTQHQDEIKASRQRATGIEGKTKLETFTHLELGNVIILPYSLARNLGGTIASVAVRFDKDIDIKEKVEGFVSRLAVTLFAGIKDKVMVYSSLAMTSFSGMSNLFIPILIASLIVLNTMMGSVYERFKEIGIYSSVGLAPVHIGSLFIAESCVFAILGAVAGYLIGQVVAKVLTTFGWLAGLTLNYSSLSAVSSTLVVMAVVIMSTIYPARKAAQMAVPDVTRRWVLPEPEGDVWKFEFPFTISGREILGLYMFFKEYFSSYEEESVGNFYTQETTLSKFRHTVKHSIGSAVRQYPKGKDEDGFLVSFKSWLAPFDLGVSQKVAMKAIPTGEYGIYEIHLEIERLSGEINTWVRLNRRFLDILRKQFLIWRTVSLEVKDEYRVQGEKMF